MVRDQESASGRRAILDAVGVARSCRRTTRREGEPMADVVEMLLAKPGLYVGAQRDPDNTSDDSPSVARVEVSPLPGGAGVMFAYEVLSPTDSIVHHEHAVLARTTGGGLVLITSHTHADVTTVVSETEPGYFPA